MKKAKCWVLFAVLFIALQAICPVRQQAGSAPGGDYVEAELLIKLKGEGDGSWKRAGVSRQLPAGAERIQDFPSINWQHVRLPQGMSVGEGMAHYRNMPGVVAAQPNFIYKALAVPDDARFGEQYGMLKIQAPSAWDLTTGKTNVVVAVIDLGVDYTHEDLSANMWRNPGETGLDAGGHDKATNGIDDDGNGYADDIYGINTIADTSDPKDDNGHGTHVAGIIGAVGNNGKGVAGLNWSVSMMAVKSHNAGGNGTSASVVKAFQYVTMMKKRGVNIRVTNSSWGGAPEAAHYDQALKDAIDAAGNADILNVCAAGNSASDNDAAPFYPASYDSPSVIAVAASDSSDNRATFSSYGAKSVQLAAPGAGILSTYLGASSYRLLSGTSMATPHVAGAAALLAAYNPSLSAASLKATLINNADQLPQWAGKVASGGRLNIARALRNPTVCAFSLSPVIQTLTPDGGSGNVSITVPDGCSWMAVSNSDFLSITSGRTGTGSGSVGYSVAPDSGAGPRRGTLNIAGQTVTVIQSPPSTNAIDDAQFFVYQHYFDFLNREPDQDGLSYWTDQITRCGANAACVNSRRAGVSAAFFTATEFQETGYFIYRLYKAALGRQPSYGEFMDGGSQVVGGPNLEQSKSIFADSWVQSAPFLQEYPASWTPDQFVNHLFDRAGLTPFAGERQRQIQAMVNSGKTRAQVLQDVVEIKDLKDREFNPAFVLMQYFGYLRRDPDQRGYDFWLDVLNNREPGNFLGMVCSFITSIEYQRRFSPVTTRSNADCGP